MTPNKIFRLKTCCGTKIFYSTSAGAFTADASEAHEVFLELDNDEARLFFVFDDRKIYLALDSEGDFFEELVPAPVSYVRNPDGSFSFRVGKLFLSVPTHEGALSLSLNNNSSEHIFISMLNGRNLPVDANLCNGCSACVAACPRGALNLREDDEGFRTPVLDPALCNNCGLCDEVCPIRHISPEPQHVDESTAIDSDNLINALMRTMLARGGTVVGAAVERFSVEYIFVEQPDDLSGLQLPNFVQPDLGNTFVEIKNRLDGGRKVLFVGIPCHVAGLKNFLRDRDDGLTTIDLICHGLPSPGVLRSYLDELCIRNPAAASVEFRDGSDGKSLALLDAVGNTVFDEPLEFSPYLKGVVGDVINRRSCTHCPFLSAARVGDITVGEQWALTRHTPAFDNGKTTSLVLVNTERGRQLYAAFAASVRSNLVVPSSAEPLRAEFFRRFRNGGSVENFLGDHLTPVGIMNLCNTANMGAALVGYATSKAIRQLGYPTVIINAFPRTNQAKRVRDFLLRNLKFTAPCKNRRELESLNKSLKKIVVGSDQVWKFGDTAAYMLDWASGYKSFISYAASFGEEHYDGKIPVSRALNLLKRFDFISVREVSGVDICSNEFGVKSVHVIDPTMLLTREHYEQLIESEPVELPDKPYVAHMLFDEASRMLERGAELAELRERYELWDVLKGADGEMRSVTEWLAGIRNADLVLTNSFHGTVFSLLFNKRFAVVEAPGRGSDRIPSLFEMLHIPRTRLHESLKDVTLESFDEPLDYELINLLIERERAKGFMFLQMALSAPPNWKEPV